MNVFLSFSCAFLWASTGIFVHLLHGVGVWQMILWRFSIAALCAFLLGRQVFSRTGNSANGLASLTRHDLLLSVLMSLYYICATFAFVLAPVALAALIVALSPCITFICRLFDGDKLSWREMLGFTLALLGVYLFLFQGKNSATAFNNQSLLGAALAFVCAIVRALYSFRIWKLSQRGCAPSASAMSLGTLLIGLLLSLVFSLPSGGPFALTVSPFTITALVALGALSTALPTLINGLVSGRLNPSIHSLIGMTSPLFSSVMAWFFLGDTLSAWEITGMIVALLGIALSLF
ncbi:DMT family transporter [Rouxiella sp. Mn2063]|uniref:DMT family transporter n=1 Tax=Rouxiella sp. Mn2063 TaxID=3395262 RepID=UPI003BBF6952